jgi:hypothetical protein
MVELGEMWRETECSVCGQVCATLCFELYDQKDVDLCAQCLRDTADLVQEFEEQPENE